MAKDRVKYIDIIKGISIIAIVLGHLQNFYIDRVVFTFHVPIFFIVTGYFINNKLPVKEFVKNKVKTLIIPYIYTCLIIILLVTIKGAIFEGWIGAKSSFIEWTYASLYGAGGDYWEPFYIKGIGAIWFLLATFFGSVFLRLTLNMEKEKRILIILDLFAIGYVSSQFIWLPWSIQAGCCATLFMYVGYLLKNSKKIIEKISLEKKIIFTLLAICVWIQFIINYQSFWLVCCNFGRGVIDIFGCFCGCYVVLLISKFIETHTKKIADVLTFAGRNSLIILCIHIVELNLIPWGEIMYNMELAGILPDLVIVWKFLIIAPITLIYDYQKNKNEPTSNVVKLIGDGINELD